MQTDACAKRTTHVLAATLLNISERLAIKAGEISRDVEYPQNAAASAIDTPTPPIGTAANEILDRAVAQLLALENTLDHIHEAVGSAELIAKQRAAEMPNVGQTAGRSARY